MQIVQQAGKCPAIYLPSSYSSRLDEQERQLQEGDMRSCCSRTVRYSQAGYSVVSHPNSCDSCSTSLTSDPNLVTPLPPDAVSH